MNKHLLKLSTALVFLIFSACQNIKNKGTVDFVLLNTEVHSLDKETRNNGYTYTEEDKSKAKNIVRFKVVNNTGEKQLLVFDPYSPVFGNLVPETRDAKNKITKYIPGIVNLATSDENRRYLDCKTNAILEQRSKYENLEIHDIESYIEYTKDAILLYPGEERTFMTVIYLPVISALFSPHEPGRVRFENLKNNDFFYLTYHVNPERFKKAMPDWELKELNSKGIHFYRDRIQSNAIPIKIVK